MLVLVREGTCSRATLDSLLGLRWYLLVSLSIVPVMLGVGPLSMKGRTSNLSPPIAISSLLPLGSPLLTIDADAEVMELEFTTSLIL